MMGADFPRSSLVATTGATNRGFVSGTEEKALPRRHGDPERNKPNALKRVIAVFPRLYGEAFSFGFRINIPPLALRTHLHAIPAVVLLLLVALPGRAVEPGEQLKDLALEARARELSAGLRCLVCQNETIDESNASLAHDIRI